MNTSIENQKKSGIFKLFHREGSNPMHAKDERRTTRRRISLPETANFI